MQKRTNVVAVDGKMSHLRSRGAEDPQRDRGTTKPNLCGGKGNAPAAEPVLYVAWIFARPPAAISPQGWPAGASRVRDMWGPKMPAVFKGRLHDADGGIIPRLVVVEAGVGIEPLAGVAGEVFRRTRRGLVGRAGVLPIGVPGEDPRHQSPVAQRDQRALAE